MAEKRKNENLKEKEKQATDMKINAYNSNDLKGLKVQHDVEAFTEGTEVILTLQDTNILTEDGDINREV